MGLITVSGQPGCRYEEVARITAQRLGFELVSASRLAGLVEAEFGPGKQIADKAYPDVVVAILARLAREHHLILGIEDSEFYFKDFPGLLRVHVVAPESVRIGNLMLDKRLDRPAAHQLLRQLEQAQRESRRRRFDRATAPMHVFDLILNSARLDSEHLAVLIERAARDCLFIDRDYLTPAAEAQIQFRVRLRLARHGLTPPATASLPRRQFAHPSEEIFANLLDFYRVAWDYEPRSFPIQWDRDGKVSEAFTPDFYLPEFDLYVELTTMKQSLVTRKNRKVKLLRELYPHVNIQVFYQKDFENLVFKYGLAERLPAAGNP